MSMGASAARILPAACGEDNVKFKVTVEKGMLEIPPPEAGKASFVFIENLNKHGVIGSAATTRFGVDGAWVGADKGDSYFVVEVDPGMHQVCANWQAVSAEGKNVGVLPVKAVAGHVYYFEAAILDRADSMAPPGGIRVEVEFHFVPMNEAVGKQRVSMYGLSTFTTK
jgi:hypothetical protein